jgi:hypothetical protein
MLDELIQEIATRIEASEHRQRARTELTQHRFMSCIRHLLTDLWRSAYTLPPNRRCKVHLDKNYYASQYCPDDLKYEPMLQAFNGMIDLGLIDYKKGSYNRAKPIPEGELTSYWLKDELAERLRSIDSHPAVHSKSDHRLDNLVLRNSEKVNIPFTHTDKTLEIAKNLKLINSCLERHWVDIKVKDSEVTNLIKALGQREDKNRRYIDLSQRTLTRMFSESRFDRHGRFYSAFWINIPRAYRDLITIDGKTTNEYDYDTFHPTMVYVLSGKDIGSEDPYSRVLGEEYRKPVKRAFNAMLNSKDSSRPPKWFRVDDVQMTWKDLVEKVVKAHKAIADAFFKGKGTELMFYDSQIAQNVMLHHAKEDAVVLPIHDSFIMHHAFGSSSGELEETMRRSYYEVMGSDIGISEQFIKEPKVIPKEDPNNVQWDDISMDTLLKGEPDYSEYTKREDAWWSSRN